MKEKLDYRKIYVEIIGEEAYIKLKNNICNKILKVYDKNISNYTFSKILEVNMKTILIIGISKYIGLDDDTIKKKIHLGINKYILKGDYNKFIKEYSEEINKIIENIKNNFL